MAVVQFGDNTADNINYGSATALDNLSNATLMIWMNPTNVTANFRGIITKLTSGYINGWAGYRDAPIGSGAMGWDVAGSTYAQCISTTSFTANEWQLFTVTWSRDSNVPIIYRGTLTSPSVDVTSTNQVGSGYFNDSSNSVIVGRVGASASESLPCDQALIHLLNTRLTLGQILQQQWTPHVTANSLFFTRIGYEGTGNHSDWSGNGQTATTSGLSLVNDGILGLPFEV